MFDTIGSSSLLPSRCRRLVGALLLAMAVGAALPQPAHAEPPPSDIDIEPTPPRFECEDDAAEWKIIGERTTVDMGGSGAFGDWLSIREQNGSFRLHLERADRSTSSLPIQPVAGQVPSIVGTVDIDRGTHPGNPDRHPDPDADEVFVDLGTNGWTETHLLVGTDERGCLAAYTIEGELGPEPYEVSVLRQPMLRSGWTCVPRGGALSEFEAVQSTDGTWRMVADRVNRSSSTSVVRWNGLFWAAAPTDWLPGVGERC